jgi:hypothetical protein
LEQGLQGDAKIGGATLEKTIPFLLMRRAVAEIESRVWDGK